MSETLDETKLKQFKDMISLLETIMVCPSTPQSEIEEVLSIPDKEAHER